MRVPLLHDWATARVLEGSIWDVEYYIRPAVDTNRMSQNFYIGDLKSGQFCDLVIRHKSKGHQAPGHQLNQAPGHQVTKISGNGDGVLQPAYLPPKKRWF